jgi:hypothetical protein
MNRSGAIALRSVALLFLLVAAGLFVIPRLYGARIGEHEREVSRLLKSLTSAEADFRANDRDWNHVNDFWTGDVAGLYYVTPNVQGAPPEIRLIERGIAEADARPLKPLVPAPVPYHGYYFLAMDEDDGLRGDPERLYKQDTDGNPFMGKVHNTSKFGFCAYPAQYGVTGRFTYIVNENNTIFRINLGGQAMPHFPDDDFFRGPPPPVPTSFFEPENETLWWMAGGIAVVGMLLWIAGWRRINAPDNP